MDVECTNHECVHFKLFSDDSVMIEQSGGYNNWWKAINGTIVEPRLHHRIGGPAVVYRGDGSHHDIWCQDGDIHRVCGPAIEYLGQPKYNVYYLKGVAFYSETAWLEAKKEAA